MSWLYPIGIAIKYSHGIDSFFNIRPSEILLRHRTEKHLKVRPNMDRLSPSTYERFIADLVGNLRLRHDITDISYGPKNRLIGASGVNHQIDVSFAEHIEDKTTFVLIECKSLRTGRAINLGHVKILKATADDLVRANAAQSASVKAHIVSSVPLQSGAARYAQHYGIDAHLVGDQGNWSFKYGLVAQVGLTLYGPGSVVIGTASVKRHCCFCGSLLLKVANENLCTTCEAASTQLREQLNPRFG